MHSYGIFRLQHGLEGFGLRGELACPLLQKHADKAALGRGDVSRGQAQRTDFVRQHFGRRFGGKLACRNGQKGACWQASA